MRAIARFGDRGVGAIGLAWAAECTIEAGGGSSSSMRRHWRLLNSCLSGTDMPRLPPRPIFVARRDATVSEATPKLF